MMTAERPIPLKKLRENFLERQSLILTTLPAASENLEDAKMEGSHQLILARIKREATGSAQSTSLRKASARTGVRTCQRSFAVASYLSLDREPWQDVRNP